MRIPKETQTELDLILGTMTLTQIRNELSRLHLDLESHDPLAVTLSDLALGLAWRRVRNRHKTADDTNYQAIRGEHYV